MTIEMLLERFEWYLTSERCLGRNTIDSYRSDLAQLISFCHDNAINAQHIADKEIQQFLLYLKKKLSLQARSIARKISSIKCFYDWAHHHHHWPNAFKNISTPLLGKRLPEYLSEAEIQQLLHTAQHAQGLHHERNKVFIYLLYGTGLRISELITITINAISFDTGFITIVGKGGKQRIVPLPQELSDILSAYIKTDHAAFVKMYGMTDYLFPIVYRNTIKPMTRQAAWTLVKQLCKRAKLTKNISPHTLRHSLATHLLKNGAHLRFVQMVLGHENLTTVQMYTHIDIEHARKEYNKKHPRS